MEIDNLRKLLVDEFSVIEGKDWLKFADSIHEWNCSKRPNEDEGIKGCFDNIDVSIVFHSVPPFKQIHSLFEFNEDYGKHSGVVKFNVGRQEKGSELFFYTEEILFELFKQWIALVLEDINLDSLEGASFTWIPGDRIIFVSPNRYVFEKLKVFRRELTSFYSFLLGVNTIFDLQAVEIVTVEESKDEKKEEKDRTPLLLFYKEERTDHQGVHRFRLGFTNGKKCWLLSVKTNDSGVWPVGVRDIIPNKLVVNNYYFCKFNVFADKKYAEYSDGQLRAIELSDQKLPEIIDDSEKKLLPLTVHTKFSAFDGLFRFQDFVEKSEKYGHRVIGLSDFASTQSFALAESISKSKGIQVLYGTELEVISEDYMPIVGNIKKWKDDVYCVFDIETSGFNPLVDELTEIAVHKYRNGQKIETFNRYLKVKKPLKKHIIELTNITDEKLKKEGRDVKEVLKEFKDFIKGSLLIAHNGIDFDLPFLNAKYRQLGLKEIEEPLLDTLRLSHFLFAKEKYKSHSLGNLCKRGGVSYSLEEAHSADYDVNVLWEVFDGYLRPSMPKDLEIKDLVKVDLYSEMFNYVYGFNIFLYAKNQEGIKDLYEVISIAHTKQYYGRAVITREFLEPKRKNLVFVSAPINSEIIDCVLKDDEEDFLRVSKFYDYVSIPPKNHFIHEVRRANLDEEDVVLLLKRLHEWCVKHSVPFLYAPYIKYLDETNDKERYKVLINAKAISGKRHPLYKSKPNKSKEEGDKEKDAHDERELNRDFPDFSYRNTKDLLEEYSILGDPSLAFKHQEDFVSLFEPNIETVKKTLHPPYIKDCDKSLKKQCLQRMKEIYGNRPDKYIVDKFESEIRCIIENKYSVIYWVSHLLVKKSLEKGFLVGSRGSVGSSFTAFLMLISEVNPLPPHYFCKECSYFELQPDFLESGFDLEPKSCPHCSKTMKTDGHNIPFETFLGFGGNKVPDIDLNFSGKWQNEAHNFLRDVFGKDKVFRAGTISSMAEKTAYAIVKTYISEAVEPELRRNYNKGKIAWLSTQIIDVKRTSGQHPGGILVVPQECSIYDFTPVNYPANDVESDWLTTHFEFDDLHDALLKFDILGHDDPTSIAYLKRLTGVDPSSIPYNDPKILEVYRSCTALNIKPGELVNEDNTGAIGLPEFGTLLTRKIVKACQPKKFADLIRISGFSHGTGVWKKNIDELVKGGKPLNEVITCRDDITLYLVNKGLSMENSFSISESIRKGKGISEEQLELLKSSEVPDWWINSAKKITYIFPKAHATAYVLMSWKIAYYKLYHPLAFYAVWFTLNCSSFDWEVLRENNFELIKKKYIETTEKLKNWDAKSTVSNKEKSSLTVYEVALEFLKRGFKFETIDINRSSFEEFIPLHEEKKLLMPFIVIEGLGSVKAKHLEEERKKGIYSKDDFIERAKINKKLLTKLTEDGIIPKDWGGMPN